MTRRVTAFLIGANALLVCLLAWLWIDPAGGVRGVHWLPPAPIKPELGSLSSNAVAREDAEVGRYMAMLDRPLFYPGRRPAPVAKGPAGARTDPLDSLHIFGLFGGSEGGGALVRVEGKTRRLKLSEALGEWTLKEIRPREAVFARGVESRTVPLVQAKGSGGTVAAGGLPRPAMGAPTFQPPFNLQSLHGWQGPVPSPMAQGVPPAPAPAVVTPAPAPASGNAPGASPSNAKPAPSSNPFVTGATR